MPPLTPEEIARKIAEDDEQTRAFVCAASGKCAGMKTLQPILNERRRMASLLSGATFLSGVLMSFASARGQSLRGALLPSVIWTMTSTYLAIKCGMSSVDMSQHGNETWSLRPLRFEYTAAVIEHSKDCADKCCLRRAPEFRLRLE